MVVGSRPMSVYSVTVVLSRGEPEPVHVPAGSGQTLEICVCGSLH